MVPTPILARPSSKNFLDTRDQETLEAFEVEISTLRGEESLQKANLIRSITYDPRKAPSFRADAESGCTMLCCLCRGDNQVLAWEHQVCRVPKGRRGPDRL
jgi:hypothetical protein